MKDFKKALLYFGAAFIFVLSSVWFSNWITPKPQNNIVQIDVTDRVHGICAQMYKEGFEWGRGQIILQTSIWQNIEHRSEAETKDLLYDMIKHSTATGGSPD